MVRSYRPIPQEKTPPPVTKKDGVADWNYVGDMFEEAKRRSQEFNGPCSECRHASGKVVDSRSTCQNPILEAQMLTIDSSYHRDMLTNCKWQRGSDGMYGPIICGPQGRLFEPRRPGFFTRLKDALFG